MRASDLCNLASDWLAGRYPDALIVREMSVGKWGKALIDIAAILPDKIVGVEIKGDGDSAARLQLQGHVYSRIASHMFLLSAPSLDASAEKHKPAGWWHLRVVDGKIDGDRLGDELRCSASGKVYYTYQPDQLPNAPAAMLECLITRELKRLGKQLVPAVDLGRTVPTMIAAISEPAPLSVIRAGVCAALRERDWLAFDRSINKNRPGRYRWADGRENVAPGAARSHHEIDGRRMTRADTRPRVHLRRLGKYWTYALGPTSAEQGGGPTPGEQLDRALANLGDRARGGVLRIRRHHTATSTRPNERCMIRQR